MKKWLRRLLPFAFAPAAAVAGVSSPLSYVMPRLDGKDENLADYKGKVVLIVNTASRCGLTPQYEGLEALYKKYGPKGFVVLGFPCNDFMGQEPGKEAEIGEFCKKNYGVTFPMFGKVKVKGEGVTPLYAHLVGEEKNAGFSGKIGWNFEKFLVGKNGLVVARFSPKTKPDAPEVIKAIEAAL